jgi:hypothetical protein
MFMEIPERPVDPSTKITGTGAAHRVSGNSASVAQGKNSEIPRNASTLSSSGIPEAASGQAKLAMMANNIVPTNGFFKGKIQGEVSVKGEATIETHAAAFFADGPEANGKFQKLMELASRGTEPSSGKVSQREIKPGRQAVIPLDPRI